MKSIWFLHRNWTGTLKEHFAWSETICVLKHRHLVNTEMRAKLSSEVFLEFNWLILYLWVKIVTLENVTILSFGFILDVSNSIFLSKWFLVAYNIHHWFSDIVETVNTRLHPFGSTNIHNWNLLAWLFCFRADRSGSHRRTHAICRLGLSWWIHYSYFVKIR